MKRFIIPAIIVIVIVIVGVCIYYTRTYNELANIYPTKNCDTSKYYYLWINMTSSDTKLSDPQFEDWCTDVLLSGPNCIGIYVSDEVSNEVLANYVQIYKDAFGFNPSHIRGKLSPINKTWCKQYKLKISSSTYKLKYC